ncbi:MAG: FAD binding domain-containing protein, partial [Dehalococcoidia bacterium]|nr:FAD binding domain-containing protein [Dehalococcoidia bacterium]
MNKFTHVNATSVADAASKLTGGAQVIAGGTDLLTYMKGMISPNPPATLVNIKTINGLDYIRTEGGALKIGALTTLTAIANSSTVKTGWAALAEAALAVASPELRNAGTIGGNICQRPRCIYYRYDNDEFPCLRKVAGGQCYALTGVNQYHSIFGHTGTCFAVCPSDTAPVLVAMGATIVTNKQSRPVADFFVPPMTATNARREQINILDADEIVTEISIPALPSGTRSTYLKFAFRKAIDFPLVSAAVV